MTHGFRPIGRWGAWLAYWAGAQAVNPPLVSSTCSQVGHCASRPAIQTSPADPEVLMISRASPNTAVAAGTSSARPTRSRTTNGASTEARYWLREKYDPGQVT